jgi:phosphohistidine phosphatase SixA
MSRELLILRHAKAEPLAPGGTDFERPLADKGRRQAKEVRDWLAKHKAKPARVLCSPSARTRETAALALPEVEPDYDPAIYEATPGTLLALVDTAADSGLTVLVGHNPGLEQLVTLLAEGHSDEGRGLPTAGIAWFELPARGVIEPGSAKLKRYWSP